MSNFGFSSLMWVVNRFSTKGAQIRFLNEMNEIRKLFKSKLELLSISWMKEKLVPTAFYISSGCSGAEYVYVD